MNKKILIISGSPKNDGNTSALVEWFCEGAKTKNADIEIVNISSLKNASRGCTSCRLCQKLKEYECVIKDDISPVLKKMIDADAIIMATPLYFFSASAQIKLVFDRMFSLYKWDNENNTMQTPLKGKTFAVMTSAYEDIGLEALEKPFFLTAEYTKMAFESLLIANAGVSGDIRKNTAAKQRAFDFGFRIASL